MNYFLDHIAFGLDPLSLFFLAVIAINVIPASVYASGYLKGHANTQKKILHWFLLAGFVAAMVAVVTARNALVFLVAWELMSVISYFFVLWDSEQERSIQAGMIYVVMTHIGTAFLVAAFMLLYAHGGSFDFTVIRESTRMLSMVEKNWIFALFLIGFGTKAGIVPLHIWLPYAHPQAPSHISGIMSGVMIKTAVYGLIRFVMHLLGVDALWWGMVLVLCAEVSCLVGITYALMEQDIKRLLAYSSVENMGVILLGVGSSMIFTQLGLDKLAVFALAAALFHVINHAIFKGLLFMGAGNVYHAMGTRNMEKMGGLIKVMPVTAFCFLVGALAISAMPPFNGFVSEWLTLQSFCAGALSTPPGIKLFLGSAVLVLALTGGMTAACFVKAFGVTFLAMPRSHAAQTAHEVGWAMRAPLVVLAALSAGFGLSGAIVLKELIKVSGFVTGVDTQYMSFQWQDLAIMPPAGTNVFLAPPLVGIVLVLCAAIAWGVYRSRGRRAATVDRTWGCGYYRLDARNEYTATAFSKPFRIAFSFFLRPYRRSKKVMASTYHVRSVKYETLTTPVFKKYIYVPAVEGTFWVARLTRRIQPGSIHLYLGYIFLTVTFLIIVMRRI